MSGLALAREYYARDLRPLLDAAPHAAALLGEGSEVLGFDDEVSTDHNFGPRAQILLAPGRDPRPVRALLAGRAVEVAAVDGFFVSRLGVDPAAGMGLADWLLSPTQVLATLVAGEVFHDPHGWLAARRTVLRWYPDDVWRYVLACAWLRVGQEEAFVGRTGAIGDDLGSRIVAARVARDLVRLAFLVERRWAPYSKWLGRAFGGLPLAGPLAPHLSAAVAATGWRDREAALCAAAGVLGAATNSLGLAEPVDPAPRQFHTRDIQVIGAERFTEALTAAITDPELRQLLARLGRRWDGEAGALPGSVDQVIDNVDVLSYPGRCRAAAAVLGL